MASSQMAGIGRRGAKDSFLKGGGVGGETTKQSDPYLRERDIERDTERSSNTVQSSVGSKVIPSSSRDTESYVGFASLPNQVYRKSVKRGFEFTLMVVGASGLGKSTLVNSLFLTDLYNSEYPGPSARPKKTTQVESSNILLKEGGVQLKLTVVDTPGFGDAVDNSNCWDPIINFIDSKYESYLNAESHVNRKVIPDSRVHCCLYFISPNGHGLKPLDIDFMKRLHDKVNIVPLIAKADTLTPDECRDFKKTILNEIAQNKINIYDFPSSSDDEEKKIIKKLKDRVPFAVIGSNAIVDSQGKRVRGRVYPWGVVEVENLEHNDFVALRNMLIRMHMQDLKDVTNNVHYENFRFNHLASVTTNEGNKSKTSSNKSPMIQMEEEKKEHVQKMKKMEAEMEQVFEAKVKEKLQKLRDSENDLQKRSEQMKKSLEQVEKELEEKIRSFEIERDTWDEQNKQTFDEQANKKDKKKTLF